LEANRRKTVKNESSTAAIQLRGATLESQSNKERMLAMGKGYIPGKGTQEWKEQKREDRREWQRKQDDHGARKNAVSRQPGNTGRSTCFESATLVLTPCGWTAIAEIEVGDLILSLDQTAGRLVERPVMRRDDHAETMLWHLETECGRRPVETTMRHRFMTERGWIQTRKLRTGDRLCYFNGSLVSVVAVRPSDKVGRVHNLITEGEHNYIAAGFVVHNYVDLYRTRAFLSRMITAMGSGTRFHGTVIEQSVICPKLV
jgi:hypothetical protein